MDEDINTFSTKTPENPVICAILLERNKGLLPAGIRFFMNIWRKIKKKGSVKPRHNHAEILIYINGLGLLTVGAVKGGFRARKFLDIMPRNHWKNLALYVPKTPFTNEQREAVIGQVITYAFSELHPYEYFNFISWIIRISSFGKINLSKDSAKRMECYEAVARCYNAAGEYFLTPEYNDIFHFYLNPKLKKLDNWRDYIEELLNT